jgi:hypothetical protein
MLLCAAESDSRQATFSQLRGGIRPSRLAPATKTVGGSRLNRERMAAVVEELNEVNKQLAKVAADPLG